LNDTTQEEITNILKKKKSTAPGPDSVPYIALKRAPPILYQILTEMFNASFKTGFIPTQWKAAFTIFIRKPKKNRFLSDNYCPITLTNTIAKLCETVIIKRLNKYMEEMNLITNSQAGFRTHISTANSLNH